MQNVLSNEFTHRLRLEENITLDVVFIILGSVFVALSSQLTFYLPFSPVPFTGQTFAVLLTGAVLGSKRGGLSLVLYLMEGVMGLPVFAGGAGGLVVLFGPTAGYLIGFVPAAVLVGSLAEKGLDRHRYYILFAFFLGQAVIYFFGVLHLLSFVDIRQVFKLGVAPFIIGDTIKAGIAMLLLPSVWKLIKREK
jgi:biotin transport system substrate-specific component